MKPTPAGDILIVVGFLLIVAETYYPGLAVWGVVLVVIGLACTAADWYRRRHGH